MYCGIIRHGFMEKHIALLLILIGLDSYAIGVEKPQTEQESCITKECHSEYSSKKTIHDPVNEGNCEACHEVVDVKEHTFKLSGEEPELCQQCHDEPSKKYLHSALEDGQCSQCHEIHASDNKSLLIAKTVGELCLECHEVDEDLAYVHGPVMVADCGVCHEPHESDRSFLLTMDVKELCLHCHESFKESVMGQKQLHESIKDGCLGCHNAHGSNNSMMLKNNVPESCFPCHQEIESVVKNAKHSHDVVAQTAGCTKCHSPHASTVKFGLKTDPVTLCISCHDKELQVGENETIADFKSQIENNKFLHGPVAEKDCTPCHTTHGSDHFRLLTAEYPSRFYAPFDVKNYQLCFNCHPQNQVLTKQTNELTDFRNGRLNLHYLHVNKPRKGRTCRACHAAHASAQPKHISKTVPYGVWEIPIQFEKTDTGGSCQSGCHRPKAYDRVSPLTYPTAHKGQNKEE